jgi:hypothetical protein
MTTKVRTKTRTQIASQHSAFWQVLKSGDKVKFEGHTTKPNPSIKTDAHPF